MSSTSLTASSNLDEFSFGASSAITDATLSICPDDFENRTRSTAVASGADMDSGQVIARFEAERQALAMMNHPNIAKVLDAGATESGRPYFVMELVKGIPKTEYCDTHKLTTRQRLELLVTICDAVQHAHQKGIIHRDLKPGNLLVELHDVRPVPKVVDFGIAMGLKNFWQTAKATFKVIVFQVTSL